MKITPEIELPDLYEPFPEDLAALCHANLRGMKQLNVHRMIQRGQYKIIATANVQDKPTRNSVPTYTSEEICELAMQIIASDIVETDDPGNYRVSFVGVGGRGRKIVSKHIRMREDQSPRAVNTMDEGDLLETQMQYIGELHQVNLGLLEVVSGMIKPLLEENKDMMKICTESVKKVGEVEAARMAHDLELRKMEDENRLDVLKEQQNQEKWNELFNHVKATGAMESIIEGLMKKFGGNDKKPEPKKNNAVQRNQEDRPRRESQRRPLPTPQEISTLPSPGASRPSPPPPPPPAPEAPNPPPQEFAEEDQQINEEIEEKEMKEQVMKEMQESPLVALASALKFSIDENGQWKDIYKTLNDDQIEIFDEILSADNDADVKDGLERMKGTSLAKLMMLRAMMDEDQVKILTAMLDA